MLDLRFPSHQTALLASVTFALAAQPAHGAETITVLTSWFAQAEPGGFDEAKAEGLYTKPGLDVDIQMGGPQVNDMRPFLAGEVDAIMGYDFQVLQADERGFPAVTVAASFQSDLRGIMTHDDVESLAGLKDKTVLVASAGRMVGAGLLKETDWHKAHTTDLVEDLDIKLELRSQDDPRPFQRDPLAGRLERVAGQRARGG